MCMLKQNSGPHVIGRKGEEASQEAKLVSTIAVSRDLKTLSMITKAFITSTTALFKVPLPGLLYVF